MISLDTQPEPAAEQEFPQATGTVPVSSDALPDAALGAGHPTPAAVPSGNDAPAPETDDEVRIYRASATAGLGTFDLGTVPASVTPPRSWRKAALFATASSGGVAVALLFAGSMLVSKPTDNQAIDGWTDRQGGIPTLPGELLIRPTGGPSESGPDSESRTQPPTESATGPDSNRSDPPSRVTGRSSGSPTGSGTSFLVPPPVVTTTENGAPPPVERTSPPADPDTTTSTTPVPQKPPPAPAEVEKQNAVPLMAMFGVAPDDEEMAANSQAFLDTVTEDPQSAHSLTAGELREEGVTGLQRKYARIAYFDVRTISIDQGRGITVNTVNTVYTDGTETTETRTLTFAGNGKIVNDER